MRVLKWLLVLSLIAGVTVAGLSIWWAFRPLPLPAEKVEVKISAGTARAAAAALSQSGAQIQPLMFALLARVSGKDKRIKAGYYEITRGMNAVDVLDKLARGDTTNAEVLFVEGWTFKQMRAALRGNPAVTPSDLSDVDLLKAIGATETLPEGLFFPSTYWFAKGASEVEILQLAYRNQKKKLADLWERRRPDLPLKTPYEALILASIVEKETGLRNERARVAGVFINRLKKGMPLQTDPAVIYGLGDQYDGNLKKRDLLTDRPYNTYTRAGLPPTPIAMPGLESLVATLNPESHEYLYFVSRGDGSSEFSTNLNDHNRAVNKFQRGAAS